MREEDRGRAGQAAEEDKAARTEARGGQDDPEVEAG